jgi:hypothetical protein
VRLLKDRLIALRRDFSIDEHYCSWADVKKGLGVASSAAVGGSGRKHNIFLDLILSKHTRDESGKGGAVATAAASAAAPAAAAAAAAREAASKDATGSSNRRGSFNVVVPLKRVRVHASSPARACACRRPPCIMFFVCFLLLLFLFF